LQDTYSSEGFMDIESFEFGSIVLIVIVGLSIFLWGAVNHENRLIEQSDNLEKVCLKAYKSDLRNDDEIKELCKNVKIKLFE
jgi:hypothetical protein